MVRHKMNQLGTRNFGAYARKMLIDGYIIKVDYMYPGFKMCCILLKIMII